MDSNASVLAVVPMLQGINNVALCNMGSIMLIIWDYCITLHKEVQHFWSGRWTLSRVLFLWNRYLSLAWAL
ncbi:hypothetical protein OE88DRAFT_1668594 [Heliocybe sulcata]|uniref:DUF6533 domain-containing protein n=1 Tax=Heliocybe sulcata TaxID=5364 RepID=A0A5C3MPI2_9AGAM|nr:hypothetical protein OE88DRAFT_1668594 [Heliocybe sulcata]